jgi:SAM-dependent methyltransferase
MSRTVFGQDYAAAYDTLYKEKDYPAECDLVERVFRTYGQGPVGKILDLGCGTGGHAITLAQRGYDVLGVDRAPDMLARARARGGQARFAEGAIDSFSVDEQFDAVLMMFAVLGYQVANSELRAGLRTVRQHLRPNGLFLCDFWYGPAVLAERPSERVRVIDTEDGQLIRAASGVLDARRDACLVRYHIWQIARGQVVSDTREEHLMRYFFEPELELLLAEAGLDLLRLGAFPELDREPDERTWNAALVARAR